MLNWVVKQYPYSVLQSDPTSKHRSVLTIHNERRTSSPATKGLMIENRMFFCSIKPVEIETRALAYNVSSNFG